MIDPKNQDKIQASESPLARLYLRKSKDGTSYIDGRQFLAGERLRKDYEQAHMSQRVTSTYEVSAGSAGRHWQMSDNAVTRMSDNAIAARERLHHAFSAVGLELSGILYQVCCVAAGFEHAEMVLALPPRSGKAVLSLALTRLARHYGLIKTRKPAPRDSISHWAVDDFRPSIMPLQHQP